MHDSMANLHRCHPCNWTEHFDVFKTIIVSTARNFGVIFTKETETRLWINICPIYLCIVALCYGLDNRGSRVRFPAGGGGGLGIFIFTTASITAQGPTQPPIQWVPEAVSLGVKRLGREADHSHLVPRPRMRGAIPPLPQYVLMAWCVVKHRSNFTLLYFTLLYFTCVLFLIHASPTLDPGSNSARFC
jgi:hypothetical protein